MASGFIQALHGGVEVSGGLDNAGVVFGKTDITVNGDVHNSHAIQSEGDVTIHGSVVNEHEMGDVKGPDGKMHHQETSVISGAHVQVDGHATNKGGIFGDKGVEIGSGASNMDSGVIQALHGGVEVSGGLDNAGVVFGKTDITVNGDVHNSHAIQSEGDVTIHGSVVNGHQMGDVKG